MTTKKPWMKTRLQQLGKTSAGLARYLKVEGPRVYEVIGGRRGLQPSEIEPTARFLEWSTEELVRRLPAQERVLLTKLPKIGPHTRIVAAPGSGMTAVTSKHDIPLLDEQGEPKTYLTAGFNGRDDLFCIYLTGRQMLPWRDAGQLVVGEKNRPPRNNDHVVIFMTINRQRVITVRQLLASDDPDTIVVKQQ